MVKFCLSMSVVVVFCALGVASAAMVSEEVAEKSNGESVEKQKIAVCGPQMDSFCGFVFGSEIGKMTAKEKDTPSDRMIVKTMRLKKPFRKFRDAELFYSVGKRRLCRVRLVLRDGKSDTEKSVRDEMAVVVATLSEKFGVSIRKIDKEWFEFFNKRVWISVKHDLLFESIKKPFGNDRVDRISYRAIVITVDRRDIMDDRKEITKPKVDKRDLGVL